MRAKVIEISWHDTQPVYSCDFQPLQPAQLKRALNIPTPTPSSSQTGLTPSLPATPTLSNSTPTLFPPPASSSSSSVGTPAGEASGSVAESPAAGGAGMTREPSATGKGKEVEHAVPFQRQYRLATAGADKHVRIWMIHPNVVASAPAAAGLEVVAPHPPRVQYLATLKRHTAPVNVVRWSPNGQTLASAGDDGTVILWVPSDAPQSNFGDDTVEEFGDKEFWRDKRGLSLTTAAIYDIAWSPDGDFIVAGTTDNLAAVFDVASGTCIHRIQDHSHYVQGVAWDPLNSYLATQSSDRSVQVYTFGRSGKEGKDVNIHPTIKDRVGRTHAHSIMDIRSSRPPSFNLPRPSLARRGSTTSDAGSAITSASEMNEFPPTSYPMVAGSSSNTPIPSTPLSNMNPPSGRPSSRRSSFSSAPGGPGSPLLNASFRGGRSPSPAPLPAIRPAPLTAQSIHQKLYGDELATNFFRRLTFSPDGSLLLTPAGQIDEPIYPSASGNVSEDDTTGPSIPRPRSALGTSSDTSKSTVYIYSRANFGRPPIAHLPGHKTTTVAVRFSPIFYDLRPMGSGVSAAPKQIILDKSNPAPITVSLAMPPPPVPVSALQATDGEKEKLATPAPSTFALPYRLMFAVASQDSVLLYDTQQAGPIAVFKGLHYSAFTDIAWSPTGDSLILSSSDGYCSIVVFDTAELGPLHSTQQHHRQLQAIVQSHSSGIPSHPPSPALSHAVPVLPSSIPRQERESSSSSLAMSVTSQQAGAPLFGMGYPIGSSASSVTDGLAAATPSEDGREAFTFGLYGSGSGGDFVRASSSVVSTSSNAGDPPVSASEVPDGKRAGDEEAADGAPKKKRAKLNHLPDAA